tara:strand:+ start:19798 stop:20460 length:663 start_codon:yes stop_codon:yes gene_type:complete
LKPLIKANANVDNIVTYLQLELAKIVSNKDTLCFTTTTELEVTVVNNYNIKELNNHSSLTNANPITIPKGTKLFITLADLPYKQIDTDLTIQYAVNENGKILHFIKESIFGYVVRHLTISLLDGSNTVQSSQPKAPKLKKPERQLITATQWYEDQQKQLSLNSIADVDNHYHKLKWTHRHYWREWSQISPADFDFSDSDKIIENFYTKTLNHFKKSLKNQ